MNYYHPILTRSNERVRYGWSFVIQRGSQLHSPLLGQFLTRCLVTYSKDLSPEK